MFICAHWHGLAKLRLHTDDTLGILDETTMRIGDEFRAFAGKTCPTFDTRELDREVAARRRKRLPKAQGQLQVQGHSSAPTGAATDEPRKKKFNLRTYKYHSLGDYANTIRRYGTTDSYSTEPVSTCMLAVFLNADNQIIRVSLSIVRQRLGISVRIKSSLSSS